MKNRQDTFEDACKPKMRDYQEINKEFSEEMFTCQYQKKMKITGRSQRMVPMADGR